MTRSLTRHLGLRLLALVMSGVVLAPKVIHAYNITRNDNVRPFYHLDSPRRMRLIFFGLIVFPACCVCLRRLTAPRLTSVKILTMVQLLGTE
jgi:hypothetical protein